MKAHALVRNEPRGVVAGMFGTIALHAGVFAGLFLSVKAPDRGPPVYAVELVAAPAPAPKQRLAPEAAPSSPKAPEPTPPAPTPEPKTAETAPVPTKKPKPKPAPPATTTPRTDQTREPSPKTSNPATPLATETPSTGSDVANVKTPGLQFPYPEYLRTIMNEVFKRWGAPTSTLRAEVSFIIMKDGAVRDIRFVTRSGNFTFDLNAQGAIEAAGNARAFGPLPDGWEADVLPVSFVFEPRPAK